MLLCTECNVEIPDGTQYLAASWSGSPSKLCFFWACTHSPEAIAVVRLASKRCVELFCERHPHYRNEIIELMGGYESTCQHPLVN